MIDGTEIKLDIYNGSPHLTGVLVYSTTEVSINSSLVYRVNYGYEGCEVEIVDPEIAILEGYITRISLIYGDATDVLHYGIIKAITIKYNGPSNTRTIAIQITTAGALMEEQDIHQQTSQLMQPWTDPGLNPDTLFPNEPDTLVWHAFNHQNILKLQTESDGVDDTADAVCTNTNNLSTSMTNYSRKLGKGWTIRDGGVLSYVTFEPVTVPPSRVINNQDIIQDLEYGVQSDRQKNTAVKQGWRAGIPGNITSNTQGNLAPGLTGAIYSFTHSSGVRHILNGLVFMVDDASLDVTFTLVFSVNGIIEFEQTVDLNSTADTEQLWIDDNADGFPDRIYRKIILDRVILLQNGFTYSIQARNDTAITQRVPTGLYYLITNMGYGTKVLSNDFVNQQDINSENIPQDYYRVTLNALDPVRYDLGNRVLLTGLNLSQDWQLNLNCTKIQFNPSNLSYTYTFGSDDDTLREIIKKIAQKANN